LHGQHHAFRGSRGKRAQIRPVHRPRRQLPPFPKPPSPPRSRCICDLFFAAVVAVAASFSSAFIFAISSAVPAWIHGSATRYWPLPDGTPLSGTLLKSASSE
jgi:hypothetical protein